MEISRAQQKVKELKSFYKNILWFSIVAAIIFLKDIFKNGRLDFSLFHGSIILTIWAIILVVKAVKIFVLNDEWEEKIIKEELEKSKGFRKF